MRRSANKAAERKGRSGDAPGMTQGGLAPLRTVRDKGRAVAGRLRGKLPSRQDARSRTEGARTWTTQTLQQHPVGAGLGVLALGFLSASLVPASGLERRAYARAAGKARDLADRLDASGRLEEVLASVRQVAANAAVEQLESLRSEPEEGPARRRLERVDRKGR
ncbi:hypothetical protein [Corallococcus sp. EGB]|uniref:hypothetical protein n=1 Tax=Corallococcus sp. EGB TaxID=1521117 RepID=UPI001CBE7899|nr:hypothetical protein [Corallococcus sp. EGB]